MNDSQETAHEHHRRSIRLRGYDYSENGAYFVTICTHNREHLFGEIENRKMRLNDTGRMIDRWWHELGNRFPDIELDAFVVMPNHIHGIIVIKRDPIWVQGEDKPSPVQRKINPVGAPLVGALYPHGAPSPYTHSGTGGDEPPPLRDNVNMEIGTTLGNIIGAFKSLTANEYIRRVKTEEFPRFEKSIWHRNYYERIIRCDGEWNAFREYIEKNPEMWSEDEP